MASGGKATEIIKRLRGELLEVFEEDAQGLCDELGSQGLITPEEMIQLQHDEDPRGRIEKMMNIILQKEEDCQTFLCHLEEMIPKFPALSDLSQHFPENKLKIFHKLLASFNMEHSTDSKLTLSHILEIGAEILSDVRPQTIQDVPWNFLRNLIALNRAARNTQYVNTSNTMSDIPMSAGESGLTESIHPLDVLCVLLHCSDSFLQQEIVSKLSMCQFAVPLLLPAADGSNCTLMLWAMRDVVKKWRPQLLSDSKGFREENVVNISMPIFSFIRLGNTKLSKSKILNQVFNPAQQKQNVFIHNDMDGGNIERKISDGLVEMSWYFPCGKSDVFPEPIAVANLRGDLETNWDQFMFQTRVSSAVFIFIENISERQFRLLSSCKNTHSRFFLIVTPGNQMKPETRQHLKNLMSELSIDKTNVIVNTDTGNNTEFVKRIQQCICSSNNKKQVTLLNASKEIGELSILVDENSPECQRAAEFARNIISTIGDVEKFKKTLIQGHPWKELSKIEKEMCRMKKQGGKDTEEYRSELESHQSLLRTAQHKQDIPESIMLFINAITHLTQKERQFFLKWTKLLLDSMARNNFFQLQKKYMEYTRLKSEELKQLDQSIYSSSLGIEHFIREIGQIYEAECYTRCISDGEQKKLFLRLPGIVADLLMEGFPVELVDGDVSNIPIQWITDVLTELDKKTGGQGKMGVISVLGVQSTGKSTLLNTMFSLQFPVASGRCTRGAFMTLLNVKESFQKELGCHFILVIDTEGLKAPELAYLEDSYEHDNELATLVAGLSDITIFTMAMEASTEMNDILQIVVHAFLRIKEVGKKPNCQFVHQSVGDVSAHEMNMRDRKKILDLLDKMTEVAAKMEKKTDIMTFRDVMDYDFEKHNWYIPALFQGVSSMASVNIGYSENVFELKKYLFDFMKTDKYNFKPLKIHEFKTWIEDLWKAVKYETFIFSFKNTLVADAYNKLCIQFSQWEWQLSQKVHNWFSGTYTFIKNQSTDTLNAETSDKYKQELQDILREEKKNMLKLLESYYENKAENAHLIEEFRTQFVLSITSLIESRENSTLKKCEEAVSIQKGKIKIQNMQNRYQKLIEDKITELLQINSGRREVRDDELQKEFDTMWENTLSDLHFDKINPSNIRGKMLSELKLDMKNKGSAVQEEINQIKSLVTYTKTFEMNKKYIDSSWTKHPLEAVSTYFQGLSKKSKEFAQLLIDSCNKYVTGKMNSSEDYTDVYCKDLLHMINEKLEETDSKKLKFSTKFELDIKIHILGNAAQKFEKLHEKFIEENDPKICLNKLKPQYFLMFQNIFLEKDECQSRAKLFCKSYLEPAIVEYIFKQIGVKIVDDILRSSDKEVFTSRTCFQFTILQSLLEEMSFKKYLRYIQSYEEFLVDWILQYISDKYRNSSTLTRFKEENLNSIEKKITDVLSDETCLQSEDIGKYLDNVCEMLNRELVISKEGLKFITFHSKANVGEFSSYIKSLLKEETKSILLDVQSIQIECILESVTLKPQEELLKKVIGCGKQCPFCKAPCEDGGINHQEHSASIHRPEGLGRFQMDETNSLATGICNTSVVSGDKFKNPDTEWKFHEYKKYKEIYPDWEIKPFLYTRETYYWKFIFVKFNKEFAKEYECEPAVLPEYWKIITKEDALYSLKMVYHYAIGYRFNPWKTFLISSFRD